MSTNSTTPRDATFVEQLRSLVAARGSITTRAVAWAIGQLRREHATIAGLARQLGSSWKTVWRAVKPELVRLAKDESRFDGVTISVLMNTSGITWTRDGGVRGS